MTTDDLLTVSAIAKQTGLDRRTIQRALLDVEPASKAPSDRYRWLDVMHALTAKDVPRETVARLAPFGGSYTRLIVWNALLSFVHMAQEGYAMDREKLVKDFGLTDPQAMKLAGYACVVTAQMADLFLVNFEHFLPDADESDQMLAGCEVPGRNAAEGEFMDALGVTSPALKQLFSDLAGSARKRTASAPSRNKQEKRKP